MLVASTLDKCFIQVIENKPWAYWVPSSEVHASFFKRKSNSSYGVGEAIAIGGKWFFK
jgi:hypothetical protein